MAAIRVFTGQHIEKHEEGGLAAIGQRHVLRGQSPVVLAVKQFHQAGNELLLALGRIVDAGQAPELFRVIHQLLRDGLESIRHRGR